MFYTHLETPVGPFLVAGDGEALCATGFAAGEVRAETGWKEDAGALKPATEQLEQYFAREREIFDLPLKPVGTPFQLEVWDVLLAIPFGETRSYGDIARAVGRGPGASRAVGAANGANPIPIVIPCHRVIGSDGTLTGFGGGIDVKQWLLEFEGVRAAAGTTQRSLF